MSEKRNIEDFISDSFENFEVQPSEMLKQRIDKRMLFINLIYFHKKKVFLLFSLICFILFGIFYFDANEKTLSENEIITNTNNNNSIEVLNNNVKQKNNSIIQNELVKTDIQEKRQLGEKQKSVEEKLLNNEINSQNTYAEEVVEREFKKEDSNNIYVKKAKFSKGNEQKSKQKGSEVFTDSRNINSTNIEENGSDDKNQTTNINLASVPISNDNETNELIAQIDDLTLKEINVNKNIIALEDEDTESSNINVSNTLEENYYRILPIEKLSGLIDNTKFLNPNYNLVGTMIDTMLINEFLKKQNTWFVDFYWAPSNIKISYNTNNEEFKAITDYKNGALTNTISYKSFGIRGGFVKNNMVFQTGLDFLNISENYKYDLILNNLHDKLNLVFNNNPYDYEQDGSYYDIDTIGGYYHYTYVQDSIIHVGDSSWVDITESNLVNMYDSVLTTEYDSLKNKSYLNKYLYIEIPFTIGYKFQFGNIDLTTGGGIAMGYLIKKSGNNISEDLQNNEVSIENLPYRKINLAGLLYFNVSYNITEKIGVWIEPTFRKSLISMYKTDYVLQRKSNAIMLKIGARIKF